MLVITRLLWNGYVKKRLDSLPLNLYNPKYSEVVRDRLSDRKEGRRLKAFTEKGR